MARHENLTVQVDQRAVPLRSYMVADGLAEARRRIAQCAHESMETLDLGGLSLNDEALEALTPSIANLPKLKRLYLGLHSAVRTWRSSVGSGIEYAIQWGIDEFLREHHRSDTGLCNAVSILPVAVLEAHPHIELLDLGFNRITDAEILALSERLPALNSLNLESNNIGEAGARAVARLTSLTSLNLGTNNIGAAGAEAIAERLTALTDLNLGSNNIGEAGARAVARLTALTSLDLAVNNIGAVGAHAVAESLTALTSLSLRINHLNEAGGQRVAERLTAITSLDLGGNNIGVVAARTLANYLTALTSLNLQGNNIGDAGTRAVAERLPALTTLNLESNYISAAGAHAVAESLTALSSLSLGNNNIGEAGVEAIADRLTALTRLNLEYINIGEAGARAVARLKALTSLNLSRNNIGQAGARAVAASLTALTGLSVRNGNIGDTGVRFVAERLTNLTSLDLGGNDIGDAGVGAVALHLTNLTSLNLGGNNIGPAAARVVAERLTTLTALGLGGTNVGDAGVISVAERLRGLTSLDLAGSNIREAGAKAVAEHLTALTSLGFRNNNIGEAGARAILNAWADRPQSRIVELDLRRNGDLSALLPDETLNHTSDPGLILAAWRDKIAASRAGQLRAFNEAKLIVIGHEAVGKTSIIRYLREKLPREPGRAATEGIDVRPWRPERRGTPEHSKWTINTWDFAGQEIAHGLHEFFLTRRSLYLVVLTDRESDNKGALGKWLQTIKAHGENSPILVVINQSDPEKIGDGRQPPSWGKTLTWDEVLQEANRFGIPSTQLIKAPVQTFGSYTSEVLRTSCEPGAIAEAMIAALEDAIVSTLNTSPSLKAVRQDVPTSWLRIKLKVQREAERTKTLTRARFVGLCEIPATAEDGAAGLAGDPLISQDSQNALLALLNDLGVIIAFGLDRDGSPVRDVTLLDPNWLSGALYKVLRSSKVEAQGGYVSKEDLRQILKADDYPVKDHHFIWDILVEPKMSLAVRADDNTAYVPRAMLDTAPPLDHEVFGSARRLRYRFGLLPANHMTRYIILASSFGTMSHRWQSGAILKYGNCPVRVELVHVPGDPPESGKRQIEIYVGGPRHERRDAIAKVRADIDRLHNNVHGNPIPGLNPQVRIPLPDDPERDVWEENVRDQEKDNGPDAKFRPEGAKRQYTPSELLVDSPDKKVQRPPYKSTWSRTALGIGVAAAVGMFAANPFDVADYSKLVGFSVLAGLATFWFALFRNPEMVFLRLFQVALYVGLPALGAYGFLLQPIEQLIRKIPHCGSVCETISLSPMPVEALIYWLALLVILVVLHFLNLWLSRR